MWLQKHLWAIVSTFLAALYVSLQLLQWKKHGDDLMMVAVSITATVALWLFPLWTIGRYWRDGRQSTSLRIQIPDAQVMSDLDAAVAWADATGKGDTSRLGLTGFCWGGRIAWLYAAHSSKLKASAAWYGRMVGDTNALQPRNPIDFARELKCPVLGLYGGKDAGIPQASIAQMRAAVTKAGKTAEIVVYPEAGHGFNADYRPGYEKAAAEDGWKRLLAWFQKYGAA